jgi:hypothetical protein
MKASAQKKEAQLKSQKKAVSETPKEEKTEKTEKTEGTIKAVKKVHTVELGPKKIVTLKPWNGKTKKKFRKIFQNVDNPENIDPAAIIQTLLYEYIDEDVYLNDGEQQYLLSKLKDISLSPVIEGEFECPVCTTPNHIKTVSDKVVIYKENTLPGKYNEIEFVDIPNKKALEDNIDDIMNGDEYDGITAEVDIESAMHIKIGDKSVQQVIDYLDELPLSETEELFKELQKYLPECKIQHEKTCVSCKQKVNFELDISQGIFETLMK